MNKKITRKDLKVWSTSMRKMALRAVNFRLDLFTAEHAETAERKRIIISASFAFSAVKS